MRQQACHRTVGTCRRSPNPVTAEVRRQTLETSATCLSRPNSWDRDREGREPSTYRSGGGPGTLERVS